MNNDMTYCDGNGCTLREQCRRYQYGEEIKNSREEGQHYWMNHCDEYTRDGYLPNDK